MKLRLVSLLVFAFLFYAMAQTACAHPMGNFSISRYSALHVGPDSISLTYRIDIAEIPTVFEMQSMNADGGTIISPDQKQQYLARNLPAWIDGLHLTIDQTRVPLRVVDSELLQRPGAAGLSALLVTIHCQAPLAPSASMRELDYADENFAGRTGWREIIASAIGEGCAISYSTVPAQDRSNGLAAYPTNALAAPPQVDHARLRFVFNPPAVNSSAQTSAIPSPEAASAARLPDRLAQLVAARELSPGLIVFSIAMAFALGTFHALAPGHGKTVVAAYLVGSRGTAQHACALGMVVTVTHTIGVFLLGLVVLFFSRHIVAEAVYPWLGFVSGMTILAIGAWQLVRRLSGPPMGFDPHDPAAIAAGTGHGHALPDRITPRSLIMLGISGGMVPCPSALILLLAAIALHRVAFGLTLVGVFSIGLATVLILIGLMMVYARQLIERLIPDRRAGLFRYMPIISSAAVSVLGLLIALPIVARQRIDHKNHALSLTPPWNTMR